MGSYLLAGAVAGLVSFLITPWVRRLSIRVGAMDQPSDRKVHSLPTPTLGGLGILIGMAAGALVGSFLPGISENLGGSSVPLATAIGGVIIFLLGAVDDFVVLPAPVKLAGQVFASGVVFLLGVRMEFILLPDQYVSLSEDVSVLVTVAWLVAMINAVNLVDGLDGLAAGIVAIAASSFLVFAWRLEQQGALDPALGAPLMAALVVGACLGFLKHNFHPARIFMGDSGSMLLGLVLGATTIAGVGGLPGALAPSASGVFLAYFPLLVPLLVLLIPLLDALLAVVRRARRRVSLFEADKNHIHHRLMEIGHGHRETVIILYAWSALAAGGVLAYTFLGGQVLLYVLPLVVVAVVFYTLLPLWGRTAPRARR